jgi:hypothetical protein
MSLWTRAQGYRVGVRCTSCRTRDATRRCDGVLRGRVPWAVCLTPVCDQCVVKHGKMEFCGACSVVRGWKTREPGEDR